MIPHRKRAQSLLTRRGRLAHGQFLIEGVRLVEEALAAKLEIDWIYHVAPAPGSRLAALLEVAAARGLHTAEVTPEELDSISDTETPQGVVAMAGIPKWSDADVWSRGTGDLVILDGVRDPGNVGTLLRTAEAAGARGLIATRGTVELANPKVVRSAMGSLFRVPTEMRAEPEELTRQCREAALPVVTTALDGQDAPAALAGVEAIALVLGGEAEGVAPTWESLADLVVRIPMRESVESLNVAVAGAIILFRRIWRA